MSGITDLPELVGRTIVAANMWTDGDSISIKLDNGGIIQIRAYIAEGGGRPIEEIEAVIRYELEFAPPQE